MELAGPLEDAQTGADSMMLRAVLTVSAIYLGVLGLG